MIWLSCASVSDLMTISERSVRRKALKDNFFADGFRYVSGERGGKHLEILLEALPAEAQAAYRNQHREPSEDPEPIINREQYALSQRRKGELKAAAVCEFGQYRRKKRKAGIRKEAEIIESFLSEWEAKHPDFTFTAQTLYAWRRKTKAGDPEKLVDKRGGHNRGKSAIPEEMLQYFKSRYLQESKPSVASCYRLTKLKADESGIVIPGLRAFEIAAENIPAPQIAEFREGSKYFSDRYMPYTERDYEALAPNDRWVSDHHLWDIFVRVPDGKGGWKAVRPWGTYWMDMRTRKVMGSIVRNGDPNADIVVCAFGVGVESFGVPRSVLLDNGRDYKARDVFNEECKSVIHSLAVNLLIDTVYAIPYNAKAKPIERLFDTFEQQFGKLQCTYAGSNAKARPESLAALDIMEYPTMEQFIAMHDQYVYEVYNNAPHSGYYMNGKSPNQMYAELPFSVRRVEKRTLFFSLMRVKGKRKVQRNGVTFNHVHYYNDNIINFIGKNVYARYNPNQPDILYLFDEAGNYLFSASKIVKLGFAPTPADYARENERRRIARYNALSSFKPDKAVRSVETVQTLIASQAAAMPATPAASPAVTEIIRNPAMEEAARRAALSDPERQYQDTLAKQESEKRQHRQELLGYADLFKKSVLSDKAQHRKVSNE